MIRKRKIEAREMAQFIKYLLFKVEPEFSL